MYTSYVTDAENVKAAGALATTEGGWTRTHRRNELLRAVLSDFANPDTTTIGPARLVEIEAEFGTLTPFLLYAEQRWLTTVTAHLDALHEDEPADLPTAGAQLWARLATGRRELRALLDAYADEPTLAAAEARTRRVVMAATGVTAERLRSDNQRAARRRGLRTALIEACGWTRRETPEVA